MKKDIYFISGLGADERMFQNIRLPGCRVHYVKWLTPHQHENLGQYAVRLLPQITTPRPILVGLSLGGMIAVEMSRHLSAERIILISSSRTKNEIPPYFHFLRLIRIHQWLPMSWLRCLGIMNSQFLFGTRSREDRKLLKKIIGDTEETFFRWAWEQVVRWDNVHWPEQLYQIHGDSDKMLPLRFIKTPDDILRGGTHFMVVNRGGEISALLEKIIYPEDKIN
ncbi:MAG: alpha/beta hydrolase [Chitinophagaceae bacterium]